jgi:hypothetical protein
MHMIVSSLVRRKKTRSRSKNAPNDTATESERALARHNDALCRRGSQPRRFVLGSVFKEVETVSVKATPCQKLARYMKAEIVRIIAGSKPYTP